MKQLKDYADEINKCSKCGLCQAVCPVYKKTRNDCAVSRGKFIMLDGVLKGHLTLSKNINKYLEMCLQCGKCTNFCPGGIDVCKIFQTAKHEYLKSSFEGKVIRFFQSKFIFNDILNIVDRSKNTNKGQILYFKGCAEKIYPNNTYAVRKILNQMHFNTIEPAFDCCGVPFITGGNIERYNEAVLKNIEIINKFDCDYVLTDCTSCEDALKHYHGLNKTVINTGDFLKNSDIYFDFADKQIITFHKPCHLKDDSLFEILLEKCRNVEYRKMENYDNCCGFSGQFAITNRKLSILLSAEKARAALNTGADIILTTCPACILGLLQGLIATKGLFKKKPKVMYLSEFLANSQIRC